MKRKFISFLVLISTFFTFLTNVEAASLSISANTKSVVTGGSVTVTINASGLAGKFSITSSNGNVLSGGTNSVWLENESKTYTFSAKSIGSATITVKPIDVADSNGNVFSTSKSVTISVVKPREKSTNNNLKSLSVDGYSITPEFNKDTLEYTVNLESSVEKITINATKEDGYASVSGAGEKEVQEGDNKFEVVVTSETGVSKTYTINAIVQDSNPITKEIDGKQYTVVKRASALEKPEGFEDTTVLINELEIPAFYNEITSMTLIGLKDEEGTVNLYQYDAKTDSYTKFESLTSISKTIIFENTNQKIDDYTKTIVTINNKEYTVYQSNINKDYLLVYGVDLETGDKGWYLYNIKDQTIQTYISDIIDHMQSEFNETLKEYKIVLLGMAGLSLFLLLIIIVQVLSKNKMKKNFLKKLYLQKETVEVAEENKDQKDFAPKNEETKIEQTEIKNNDSTKQTTPKEKDKNSKQKKSKVKNKK